MKTSAGEFAKRVKALREEKELSLMDVERYSAGRITNGYVSRIENGHEVNLSRDTVIALADGLRVPVSTIVEALFADQKIVIQSREEETLLQYYRQMSDDGHRWVMIVAEAFAKEAFANKLPEASQVKTRRIKTG